MPEASTEEPAGDTASVSADWKTYQISVNGSTLTLPMTYDEFSSATGFSMKSAEAESFLEGGYYTSVNFYQDDTLAAYTDILNASDEDMKYTDCPISRVAQTKYMVVDRSMPAITFPGGLKAGEPATLEDLTALFGEPSDTSDYSSDGYEKYTYEWYSDTSWTTSNFLRIEVVNGVIDQITLDHRDY